MNWLYGLWSLAFLYGCIDYGIDYRRKKRQPTTQPRELEITKVNRLMDNILFK